MNDFALNVIISALSGISGTILGFLFGEAATKRREERHKREQKDAVYTLLRLEIAQNLTQLDNYWRFNIYNIDGSSDDVAFQQRLHLIREPLPAWSHVMWESQTAALPLALTERQISNVFYLQGNLERMAMIRSLLSAALPPILVEQYNAWRACPVGECKPLDQWQISFRPEEKRPYTCAPVLEEYLKQFNLDTFPLWRECENIFYEIDSDGNPLRAPMPDYAKPNLFTRLKGRLPSKRQQKQP